MITNSYIAEFFYKSAQIFVGEYLVHGRQFAGLFVFMHAREAIFGITNFKSRWGWMISKTGRLLLEKRGSLTATSLAVAAYVAKLVAEGVSVHVAQNMAMQRLLKGIGKGGLLENVAVRAAGKPGQGMGTYGKDMVFGVADGLLPEVGILHKEIGHKIGHPLQSVLQKQNLNIDSLPKRHEKVLGLIGEGRFRDAYRLASTPETREAANAIMGNIFPGSDVIIDQAPVGKGKMLEMLRDRLKQNNIEISVDQERVNKFLEHLEQKYQEDPLTAGIAKLFRENRGAQIKQMLKGNDSLGKKVARTVTRDAVRAVIAKNDFVTAGLNEGKRLLNWEEAGRAVPVLGKLQKKLGDKFVTQPMEESFVKGLNGEATPKYVSRAQARMDIANARKTEGVEAADNLRKALRADMRNAYGFNFLANRINHTMNTLGLGAAKAGISPEHYKQLKENAPKIRETWCKLVEDMRLARKPVLDTTAVRVDRTRPAIAAAPVPPPMPPMPQKPSIVIPKKKPGFSYVDFSNEMDIGAGLGGLLNKRAALC